MSDLESKAVEILDRLDAVVTQYTPEVANAAIEAVRITCIGNAVVGCLCILFTAFLCIKVWPKIYNKYKDYMNNHPYSDADMGFAIFNVHFIGVLIVVNIATVFHVLDIWNWVGIFNPELALAHKLTGL